MISPHPQSRSFEINVPEVRVVMDDFDSNHSNRVIIQCIRAIQFVLVYGFVWGTGQGETSFSKVPGWKQRGFISSFYRSLEYEEI